MSTRMPVDHGIGIGYTILPGDERFKRTDADMQSWHKKPLK